ncbi:hypothetical protein ABOM_004682 [Aspergillus bombycis]|uniref:Arrestin-like N-terminal domain-containing protein n=1 Tax=Aspergillus bombycis TaxID=109264 RepID=A0A1F8A4L9_9EURO|nr:hypothetical protein ABOM_004682 [Aspergillus bombycis]OGM46661.1 hypothetical protein ABOM_004682 [Aspergillus bombycis]
MAITLDVLFPNTTPWTSSHRKHRQLPIFESGQGVKGTVVLSSKDQRAPVSGIVKIALEGTLFNHVDLVGESPAMLYHTYVYQKIINLNAIYPEQQMISDVDQCYHFRFLVPDSLTGPVSNKYGQQIPSSLHINFSPASHRAAVSCSKGTCKIDYRIRAQFLVEGRCVVETTRPFTLWASQGRQPPVCTEDFPGEYRLSALKTLRRPLLQPAGKLHVYSHEPLPLEFSPEKEGAATSVRLRLRYGPLKNGGAMRIPPPRFYGIVRSNLTASTFISIQPQRRSPATCDAAAFPFTFETRKSYPSQLRKICFPRWTRSETGAESIWETEAEMTFKCHHPAYLTPSFSSMLVSRRYSLKMYMVISGHGHAAVKLELPIQVVYTGRRFLPSEEIMYLSDPVEDMPPAYSP